LTLAIFGDSMI